MMDMYIKLFVGEKPYSTIGEETDSVTEEIELLNFLGASNDIELGVLDGEELADYEELAAIDYGELGDYGEQVASDDGELADLWKVGCLTN
ncbi:uncharacterized protein Pyn_08299 [Prunus yedoensis var. nudiflora]|uniref:Uncharacterized protein n=1 Tax=Prunus yedoensis var. nudiflora TaxID=2094558 RepID=A0A314XYF9_PRUYE|nr:uncharacterized protein Pyn_08299 [Prunus yedoensis var. nudiflora]